MVGCQVKKRHNFFPPDLYFFGKPLNINPLYGSIAFGIEIAVIKDNGLDTVRSTIINKILSLQYRLGKLIGRKRASHICSCIERIFTNLFGREVYCDGK